VYVVAVATAAVVVAVAVEGVDARVPVVVAAAAVVAVVVAVVVVVVVVVVVAVARMVAQVSVVVVVVMAAVAALDLERVGVRVALGLERNGRRCRVVRVALGRPPAVGRRVVEQGGGVACGGVGACEIPQPSPPLELPVAPHGAKRVIRTAEVAVRQAVRKLELRQTVRPKLLHAQRRRCARRRRAPRASEGPRRA
jgi:hypothetical protein